MTKKKALLLLTFMALVCSGFTLKRDMDSEEAHMLALFDEYRLELPETIEYADETTDLNQYVVTGSEEASSVINVEKLNEAEDLHSVGTRNVRLSMSAKDKYGREYTRTVTGQFAVTDTQRPVIETSETDIAITAGDVISLGDYIERIYDPVDGDLEYAEEPGKGTYWFEGSFDSKTPGTYEVKAIAEDINGNQSEERFTVTVKEKPKPKAKVSAGSSTRESVQVASSGSVNFDNAFAFAYADDGNMQSLLDSGYLISYWGDYFHHNTSGFMNLFWKCKAGTQVTINGTTYTSGGIYHGWCTDTDIFYDNGSASWYNNSTTELITCDGGINTTQRWILVLY